MKRKVGLILLALGILALVTARTHRVSAQGCPPPAYTSAVLPWTSGSVVDFSFDSTGTAVGDPSNPPPKFSLASGMESSMTNGIMAWNSQSQANGSSIVFSQASGKPWTISTAWPKASVTYTASNGQTYTYQVDATPPPGSPALAADTFYLPDHTASGAVMSTAAAAITLINTNGTYSAFGNTYPVWDPNGSNFSNALQGIGTHESGHGFGLDDQSACGDIMSHWGPATASNPSGGTNNNGGCQNTVITNCDDQEIRNNPNGLYNPPPPSCPNPKCPADGGNPIDYCAYPDTGCPPGEQISGSCCQPIPPSPVIIDLSGNGFLLTSAAGGVSFDISGTGRPIQMGWTASGADNAFLALPGADGLVHGGKQLFGNFTPQPSSATPNGFAALAVYDLPANGGNGDGIIDSRDAIFASLRLWTDANHDGISQPDELHTLPSLGVTSISLNYKETRRTDQYGNVFRYRAQVNPGETTNTGRIAYDVFFVTSSPTSKNTPRSLIPANIPRGLIPADTHKCSVPVPTKGGMLSSTGRF